ncbi:unnamed protein product [Bursaphelenchus xylophilus]|uniref:dolichol kinase n=1 Tax=Bursaphelenchus xylophilus TaxID=6326 RepID=A0A1I7ST41_BURXY|nr:unnamed protein product [Bursaphelenchus xylophilus]CAG9108747.1 unnamed protein product [Bursaphelenchus xylophilus]
MFDWAEPYNRFDVTIILLGYGVSLAFGYSCKALKQLNPWTHNIVLAFYVFVALVVFAWKLEINPIHLPVALLGRVYDGSVTRRCLLLFWLINVFASVAFCVRTAYFVNQVTTSHRKFFHVTVSAVAISGFLYDPPFTVLCGHIVIVFFIILEILRVHRVQPWCHTLDANMLPFLDGQDNRNLVLTPIHLIGGVFAPSLLDFMLCEPSNALRPSYYSGVITVGVGDACAALIGSNFGRIRWGVKLRKTVEGSAAMLFGQIVAHIALFGLSEMGLVVVVIYSLSTILEAALDKGDNIVLPIFTFFLLKLREYFVYP